MKTLIQEFLLSRAKTLEDSVLKDAVAYVLTAGGKRFRPLIVLTVIESYGLDPLPYIPLASALEMIHVYSLIHDDLPAMDNDDLRHGVKTLHLAFDEATAILVGDALLTDAFTIVSENKLLPSKKLLEIVKLLSTKAGYYGMVYGQHLDIIHEKKVANLAMLKKISKYKTGQLMEAAFVMGAMIAAPKDMNIWSKIGLTLGLIFQIQDDVLEATTSVENMQKSKSDEVLNKATFVSQSSIEASRDLIASLIEEVDTFLSSLRLKNHAIITMIEAIKHRTY